ncbi:MULTISPECIES: hypothetical protein [Paraclostridium]|uniref:OCRE domain-containing protein n=2 Tax=Paraclostridium TaxID=1849822 RepID=A0A0M3DHR5_9FIRM|nr:MULTISPECIES: hypothetical protein [Paraclostridium]MCU9809021.1 hypothetical protein [Paraclostridium sp. AKS46]EQK47256.1 hypothetical protein C671_0897 [[Clostridium] bifermentans ATCC 19299] [Paraclostridium bifermentans ATCC 19299]KKY02145.1 hypothetical protein VN21_04615 [Paraclostridium benzoelyticum]MCE9674465.1 hypothetical protein [Paraclostridium bifermentans]MCR1875093.1 hypothetical protein [Paraclostridium bifermentans]
MKKSILVLSILVGGLFLVNPTHEITFAQENNNQATVQKQNTLTQADAQQLLINNNDKVNYIFQGTSDNFKALQDKGLKGYVFLPDVESDMGYFVDQDTSHIYYFHPSGYLELIK